MKKFDAMNDSRLRELIKYTTIPFMSKNDPAQKFFIYGVGRDGSSLLVSLLNSHQMIHCDSEVLHNKRISPKLYIKACEKWREHEVYGFKLLNYHLNVVHNVGNDADFLNYLVDDSYKIIYLKRNNVFAQAISNVYARQANCFHNVDGKQKRRKIELSVNEVQTWINNIQDTKKYMAGVLEQVKSVPLVINYEEDLSNPESHQATANRIFDWLGLVRMPVKTSYKKVTSGGYREKIANYDEIICSVADNASNF